MDEVIFIVKLNKPPRKYWSNYIYYHAKGQEKIEKIKNRLLKRKWWHTFKQPKFTLIAIVKEKKMGV